MVDAPVQTIGLTSEANRAFTESLGCYDRVMTYGDIDLASIDGDVALVDMAGNEALAREVHEGLGAQLVRSVRIGGTHRGAGASPGDMPGPERSFFFIPDFAERAAAEAGHPAYHARFASAWADFAAWATPHLRIEHGHGGDEILAAYQAMASGTTDPTLAQLYSY